MAVAVGGERSLAAVGDGLAVRGERAAGGARSFAAGGACSLAAMGGD